VTTDAVPPVVTVDAATGADDVSEPGEASDLADVESTDPTTVQPEGFITTQAVVTKADGTTCELCLWLADTSEQRALGLMFATDLGPTDGMAFRYPNPHTGRFWMKNTVLPLSIAFFAPDGSFMGEFDMEPCTTDSCPRYATPRDFLVAVEVAQGDLDAAGLVTGSRLELLDIPCGE
jgi:uncharacterized membrane protein (UPF0127 family)